MRNEPESAISHLAAAALSLAALPMLIVLAALYGSHLHVVSFAIYGFTMFMLYLTSTLYHSFNRGSSIKRVFKKFDHIMIFWFIAGTYTPLCLVPLHGPFGWKLLIVIWTIALAGTIFKSIFAKSPGWINSLLYAAMGWASLIAIGPLYKKIGMAGLAFMAAGGLFYTVGAWLYAHSKTRDERYGRLMHAIFHYFVIAGSLCFYSMMVFIVLPLEPS